jgi:hypothetical protein
VSVKKKSSHLFPFFGAGEATYFEWAEVHVYFAREPTKTEKAKIAKRVPPPLRDSIVWEGQALMAASGQFAHMTIAETYQDTQPRKKEYQGGDRFFFAKQNQVHAFNEDTEAWLKEAHGVVPIVAAFRAEDQESGGTDLSPWHAWSIDHIKPVLATMMPIAKRKKDDHAKYMLGGVLLYAHVAKVKLTKEQRAFLQSESDERDE